MKNTFFSILFTGGVLLAGPALYAQVGNITSIAGNGSMSYSGDGGPATAAAIRGPQAMTIASNGNMYIADWGNNRIRAINTLGVISTIAGTGTSGYSGDSGAATAAMIFEPSAVITTHTGEIVFSDNINNRIRKINSAGIISTIAGTGTAGYSGDGGPATAAKIYSPIGLAEDNWGNIYFADNVNNKIRKIDTTGIITTFAGSSTYPGYSGDGGPASAARFSAPGDIIRDNNGNFYIADLINFAVRKITPAGIISTIAGNGSSGFSGDGGPATAAKLVGPSRVAIDRFGYLYIDDGSASTSFRIRRISPDGVINTIAGNDSVGFSGDGGPAALAVFNRPVGLTTDPHNNVYIADSYNGRIRKIGPAAVAASDSLTVFVNNTCTTVQFQVEAKSFAAGQHIKSYFDNNQIFDTTTSPYLTCGIANFTHTFGSTGNYTIKHVLYNGAVAVDSVSYTHFVTMCQTVSTRFYYDALGTCAYNDSTENRLTLPVLVEIDSNSGPIDTISATSGLNYLCYGAPGDIYTFRVIQAPSGSVVTCPSTGFIFDTLFTGTTPTKYIGLNCSTSTAFDLSEKMAVRTGMHMQTMEINISDAYCSPVPTTLTLNFSPQYVFGGAYPAPTTVAGNTATWDLGPFSFLNSPSNIQVGLSVPGAWLTPGDTIMTYCVISPNVGDTDTTNNVIIRTDTVKSSFDPNEMSVTPNGCLSWGPATQLQYTIMFENTGNDTAHNIYVMDTLSDNVDPRSLRIVAASNTMDISKWYDNTYHNIYKFDFPKINLLDSSHHNQCDGMVIFTINTLAGLAPGSTIFNHAGIFFDDNPVVMTNYVENVVWCDLNVANIAGNQGLSLYPNPAQNQLTITNATAITNITVTNLLGQTVLSLDGNTKSISLDVTSLPQGIYFVKVNGTEMRKFEKF